MISLYLLVLFVSATLGRPADKQNEELMANEYNPVSPQPELENQRKRQQPAESREMFQQNLELSNPDSEVKSSNIDSPPSEIHSRRQQDRNRLEKMDNKNLDLPKTNPDNQVLPPPSKIDSSPFDEIHSRHQQHRQQTIEENKPIELMDPKNSHNEIKSPSSSIDSFPPDIHSKDQPLDSDQMNQQKLNLVRNIPDNQLLYLIKSADIFTS